MIFLALSTRKVQREEQNTDYFHFYNLIINNKYVARVIEGCNSISIIILLVEAVYLLDLSGLNFMYFSTGGWDAVIGCASIGCDAVIDFSIANCAEDVAVIVNY